MKGAQVTADEAHGEGASRLGRRVGPEGAKKYRACLCSLGSFSSHVLIVSGRCQLFVLVDLASPLTVALCHLCS